MTIYEVLEIANYNLNENNMSFAAIIGADQVKQVMKQLEEGKGLYDEFEEEED